MPVAPYDSRSLRRAPAIAALVVIVAAAGVLALALNVAREGGLGVAATQTRAVPPFSRIDLAGSNVVRVHAGAARSIIVHGDANLIDRITTRVAAGTLGRLGRTEGPGRRAARPSQPESGHRVSSRGRGRDYNSPVPG